jgi:hypothetical protein
VLQVYIPYNYYFWNNFYSYTFFLQIFRTWILKVLSAIMCIELQYKISIKHQYNVYLRLYCEMSFSVPFLIVPYWMLKQRMMKRLSAPLYNIVIIHAFFQFDAQLLLCSLRFSYFVCTVSKNVRFTCNSRTIIPLIVYDRSTDVMWSLLLPASKKAYRPLAGLTSRARHTHSLSTFYIFPLWFNFHPATTPRLTGIPSPHDL